MTPCPECGAVSRLHPGWCGHHAPCPQCGDGMSRSSNRRWRCANLSGIPTGSDYIDHDSPQYRHLATYRPVGGGHAEVWRRIEREAMG